MKGTGHPISQCSLSALYLSSKELSSTSFNHEKTNFLVAFLVWIKDKNLAA